MSISQSIAAIKHHKDALAVFAAGGDASHDVDGFVDSAYCEIFGGDLADELEKFIRAFPGTGPAGAVGFIRLRMNADLLAFETELLTRGG